MDTTKCCSCCRQHKPLSLFPTDKRRPDGKYVYCKPCVSEKSKKSYAKDIDHSRSLKRAQSQKHSERNRAIGRRWYEENKERHSSAIMANRRQNKERYSSYSRQWAAINPEKVKEKQAKFRATEKGKLLSKNSQSARRFRQRGAGGGHTYTEWEALKSTHNYACCHCQKREPDIKLTRDHIIPISKGGSSNINNIQPLCQSCNSKKGNKHEVKNFSIQSY